MRYAGLGWAWALVGALGAVGCLGSPDDRGSGGFGQAASALTVAPAPAAAAAPAAGSAKIAPNAPGGATGGRDLCVHDGDVDFNGVVSSGDAQLAFLIGLGMITPTPEEECAADCNGDGIISSGDAQRIFWTALGPGRCPIDQPLGAPCVDDAECLSQRCLFGLCRPHAASVIAPGAAHVQGGGSGGTFQARIGFGFLGPIGTSVPSGPGAHSSEFGPYPLVRGAEAP